MYRIPAPRVLDPPPAPLRPRRGGRALLTIVGVFAAGSAVAVVSASRDRERAQAPVQAREEAIPRPACARRAERSLYGHLDGVAIGQCFSASSTWRDGTGEAPWEVGSHLGDGFVLLAGEAPGRGAGFARVPSAAPLGGTFFCAGAGSEVDETRAQLTLRELARVGSCASATPVEGELTGCVSAACDTPSLHGSVDGVVVSEALGRGSIGGDGIVAAIRGAQPGVVVLPPETSADGAFVVLPGPTPGAVGTIYCVDKARSSSSTDWATHFTLRGLARVGSCTAGGVRVTGELHLSLDADAADLRP